MLSSYKLLSHPNQLLRQHLYGVAEFGVKTHRSHGIKDELTYIIYLICLAHDFGKGTYYFQEYIKKNPVDELKKAHGLLSAIFAFWLLPEEFKLIGFLAVKFHHGDIGNTSEEVDFTQSSKAILDDQLNSMDAETLEELNDIYKDVLDGRTIEDFISFTKDINNLDTIKEMYQDNMFNISYKNMMTCQYIYSILLTADKSQLILDEPFVPKEPFDANIVLEYVEKLVEASLKNKPELAQSDIFKLRNQIFKELVDSLSKVDIKKHRIFSINVPTGGGKTLLSYHAAFYLANEIKKYYPFSNPSVISSLPFTSVIDQNHEVLLDILKYLNIDDEDVLKFHSVTPIKYKDYDGYDARFCFENWQSRVISTTFVQLFNTIFKVGDNSIVNRFHRLSNSVVILDEVQNIDSKYFDIIETILNYISEEYNIYFILVTATIPLLLKPYNLIPNNEEYFKALNRVYIENHTDKPVSIDEFKDIVSLDIANNPDKSFLIILNTVKSSRKVFKHLKNTTSRKVIYLSTEIYPALRLYLINKIRKSNEKYILVSTQLVEAGVDIDMDIVYRDFAPLDSINQSAGRCNRNGIKFRGCIKVYSIYEEKDGKNKFLHKYVYPEPLIVATTKLLAGRSIIEEKDFFELNQKYFENVNKIKPKSKSKDLLKFANSLSFKSFRNNFNLIESTELFKVDIVVNATTESDLIIKKLNGDCSNLSKLEIKNLFRKLRKYTASVSREDFEDGLIKYKTIDK